MMQFDQGHALLIAPSDYVDPQLRAATPNSGGVAVPLSSTRAIHTALVDPLNAAYPGDHVITLSGAQSAKAVITTTLESFALTIKPNRTLLILFDGHAGLGADNEYYFAAQDTLLK